VASTGERRNSYRNSAINLCESGHFEELGIDGKTLLNGS
jgi:hypothetical protein